VTRARADGAGDKDILFGEDDDGDDVLRGGRSALDWFAIVVADRRSLRLPPRRRPNNDVRHCDVRDREANSHLMARKTCIGVQSAARLPARVLKIP
jgi:hypothetical protein